MGDQIARRSISGVRWASARTIVLALLAPLAQIIKARFLSPEDLGAVAVFTLVYGMLQVVEQAGLGQVVVQKAELDAGERFTVFAFSLVYGLVGVGIMIGLAGVVARVLGVLGATPLLICGSPLFFLVVVEQYFRSLLQRDLLYRGPAIVETAKRLANVVFLLVFLMIGLDAMAVVMALSVATLISTTAQILTAVKRGVVRFRVEIRASALRYLWRFGTPVAAKQVFGYIAHRADELLVALALDPAALGLYHLAKETLDRLRSLINSSYAKLLLSLFSRIRDNDERMARAYSRVALMVSYVGVPVFVGIALTCHELVPVLFGQEWIPAIPVFRLLSIGIIPIVLTANLSTSLLYAVGKPRLVLVIDLLVSGLYFCSLFLARTAGLTWILALYVTYCYATGFALQIAANRSMKLSASDHIRLYLRVLIRVAPMVVAVLATSLILGVTLSPVLRLVILVLVGLVSFVGVTAITDRQIVNEFRQLMPSFGRAGKENHREVPHGQ